MNIRKYVKHIRDLGANTISFGLGIVIQQLVLMPLIAKYASEEALAEIIVFHSIFNVLCVVLGEELGNVKMIRNSIYEEKKLKGDFPLILLIFLGIVIICTQACYFFFDLSYLELLTCTVVLVLGIVRYYCMSSYRLKQQFHTILIIHCCYCVGEVLGLVLVIVFHYYFGAFLVGELFALICWLIIRHKAGEKFRRDIFSKTPEMKNSLKTYGEIGSVAAISNGITYLDRLLAYPLAGAAAMNMYYGASSMSKMLSLVVSPISTFMLAKLAGVKEEQGNKIINKSIRIMLPLLVVFTFGSIAVTYVGVRLFYPQYLQAAIELLIPIGLATSLGLGSTLLKPVIMRFFEARSLLLIQIWYAVILIICMYFFSMKWGMHGFAWATCVSRLVQLFAYLALLMMRKREGIKC